MALVRQRCSWRERMAREQLCQEIVQETCLRAWAKRDEYDVDIGEIAGWLHAILNHVAWEFCRKENRHPKQPDANPEEWDSVAAELAEPTNLAELLECLPHEMREIISLHHLDELPHREIARRLGISPAASQTRLARAMKELRRVAARKEGGE
jgi:RNA polymerase sigma-70 factor (ECF subfamily)